MSERYCNGIDWMTGGVEESDEDSEAGGQSASDTDDDRPNTAGIGGTFKMPTLPPPKPPPTTAANPPNPHPPPITHSNAGAKQISQDSNPSLANGKLLFYRFLFDYQIFKFNPN